MLQQPHIHQGGAFPWKATSGIKAMETRIFSVGGSLKIRIIGARIFVLQMMTFGIALERRIDCFMGFPLVP